MTPEPEIRKCTACKSHKPIAEYISYSGVYVKRCLKCRLISRLKGAERYKKYRSSAEGRANAQKLRQEYMKRFPYRQKFYYFRHRIECLYALQLPVINSYLEKGGFQAAKNCHLCDNNAKMSYWPDWTNPLKIIKLCNHHREIARQSIEMRVDEVAKQQEIGYKAIINHLRHLEYLYIGYMIEHKGPVPLPGWSDISKGWNDKVANYKYPPDWKQAFVRDNT